MSKYTYLAWAMILISCLFSKIGYELATTYRWFEPVCMILALVVLLIYALKDDGGEC